MVRRLRVGLAVLLAVALMPVAAFAQQPAYDVLYRPLGTPYRVLESPHFSIIYQEGLDDEAREAAAVLERTLPATQALVGMDRPLRMPVVLNRFNDRANGYVTPLPFKQEIEGISIKSKMLSPAHPSWIEQVAPHELVHAAQADVDPGFGFGHILRWFGPDLGRIVNLTIPLGLTEGIAVYQESNLKGEEDAGRLNHSLFTMQFRAAMLSDDPWSLPQMLDGTRYSFPAGRHYIGGAHLYAYLAEQDDGRFFRDALAFYNRFPFFGFGPSLWHATGKTPWRLGGESIGDNFTEAVRTRELARLEALGPLTEAQRIAGDQGLEHRMPRWLDDRTLLVYARGYALRPGFYRVDVETGARDLVSVQAITDDYYYALNADCSSVLFSRYVVDPLSSIKALAEVQRLSLVSGEVEQLTEDGRVHAPVEAPTGGIWAVQNDGQYTQWVHMDDGSIERLTNLERLYVRSLHPSPDGELLVALLNVRGEQGVFEVTRQGEQDVTFDPLLLFEEGAIYDPHWSDDGRYLVFAADPDGIANIYVWDREQDRLMQVTNVAFGAIEPALSPDGSTLAYIEYQDERYDLMRMPFTPDAYTEVPRPARRHEPAFDWQRWVRISAEQPYDTVSTRPYRSWRYAAPRIAYPVLRYEDDGVEPVSPDAFSLDEVGIGLGVQGTDPLQSWWYAAEGWWQYGRAWGRGQFELGTFPVRPYLRLYDRPGRVSGLLPVEAGFIEIGGYEERGVQLGVRLPITLRANVFNSFLLLGMEGEWEDVRLLDDDFDLIDDYDYIRRFSWQPYLVWQRRIQANYRDVVPNNGQVFSLNSEVELWREANTPLRRALVGQADVYLPWLGRANGGLRLGARFVTQNQSSIFSLNTFLPRGYDEDYLPTGNFIGYEVEYTQPLWYIDDGFVVIPAFFDVLYGFAFAETIHPVRDWSGSARRSSLGAGLGLQMRWWSALNTSIRVGLAYLPREGEWEFVSR